ncbi:isopropylmalate isomerase [Altericroceibacterium endophyticum]|uniref:Isopropylmalate isomerase n=1 Tax=Altericroceibacterium endophyticum TaxID=1808508 RepID=A0A6I4T8H0_9SPHN|nr:isopropylmalate isomerase [Altericroceibacterium endophyticum]MXO66313.1 isopropylmalate isomerase [Altericroceibacterium endophyticum]
MSKSKTPSSLSGKAAIAGAIGSAAVAAGLLYMTKRKEKKAPPVTGPHGEPPETD